MVSEVYAFVVDVSSGLSFLRGRSSCVSSPGGGRNVSLVGELAVYIERIASQKPNPQARFHRRSRLFWLRRRLNVETWTLLAGKPGPFIDVAQTSCKPMDTAAYSGPLGQPTALCRKGIAMALMSP